MPGATAAGRTPNSTPSTRNSASRSTAPPGRRSSSMRSAAPTSGAERRPRLPGLAPGLSRRPVHGLVPAPGAHGYLMPGYNYDSLVELRPVNESATASETGRISGLTWLVATAGVVAVGMWLSRRGGASSTRPSGRTGRARGGVATVRRRKSSRRSADARLRAHRQLLPVPRAARSGRPARAEPTPHRAGRGPAPVRARARPAARASVRHLRDGDGHREPRRPLRTCPRSRPRSGRAWARRCCSSG